MVTIRCYPVEGHWVVSANECWVPGAYISEAVARRAARDFSDEQLVTLRSVYRVDGEDRPVTDADLDRVAS